MRKVILITGCAGFIGFHLSKALLNDKNNKIIGIDNLNKYYDVSLKNNRLKILKKFNNFYFYKINIQNQKKLKNIFEDNKIKIVINLAAQAGVRYSITNPREYLDFNVNGFFNILELSRLFKIKHLVFASTSSVYGDSNDFPLSEEIKTDSPLSFYAATKKSNEVFAHSYSNIYKLQCTGLRFFTVYGTYGRPDMALHKFVKSNIENKKINLFNYGKHKRDFTHVNDIVQGIEKIINYKNVKKIPYEIFNIGSNKPINLKEFIKIIEKITNKRFKIVNLPLQKGDVEKTHANISKISKYLNYKPKVNIKDGVKEYIDWYKEYYKIL